MSRRQTYTSLFLTLVIVVGLFLIPSVASAELTMESVSDSIIITFTKIFLWLASLGIQLAIFFLKFFILIAGYNGYINADVVKFGWSIIRDVANMFFIVILLVIAFGTILGLEQYEWKKTLPKLVFAAIFVNFSNVICQLIIDISQVFTITFLNAVAGTAGGNLIALMRLDDVFTLMKTPPTAGTEIQGDLLIGALFAMFFCFTAAASVGSYLVVMLYRLVSLWCLIILSPLAFVFSVLPSTKSYADEFWKEFVNNVIAAPIMVFFLWLAFSTFGGGDVVTSNIQANNALQGYQLDTDSNAVGAQTSVTISSVSSWLNLANVIVAMALMELGREQTKKLGLKGSDLIDRFQNFAKNAFTVFAGVKLAQWGYNKAGGAAGIAKTAIGAPLKLVDNVIPVSHNAKMIGEKFKRGWAKTLGARSLRREGELSVSKHATDSVIGRLVAEGERLSRAHHTAAVAVTELEAEKRRGDNEAKEGEATVKLKMISDQEDIYNKRVAQGLAQLGNRPPTDKQMAEIEREAIQGLSMLEAMSAEGLANRQIGKATKRDNFMLSGIRDAQRVDLDNKKRKYRKEFEEKDWAEDMQDFAHSDFDERFEEIEIEYKKLQALNAKKASGQQLTAAEEKQSKAATKNLMQLSASAFENGQGNFLWNKLGGLDTNWENQTVTSDNQHEALMSLWTGKTVQGSTDALSTEQELRKRYGTDWNLLGRSVMRSMNASADKTGNEQDRAQILKGKNADGLDTFGFANNMAAGDIAAAGTNDIVTGNPAMSGAARRAIKQKFARSTKTIGKYMDPMSLIEVRSKDMKAMRVRQDEESQKTIESIKAATANELRAVAKNLWNTLSGGTFETGGNFDATQNTIIYEHTQRELANTVQQLFEAKVQNWQNAVAARGGNNTPETDKLKEDAVTFMRLLTRDATFDETRLTGPNRFRVTVTPPPPPTP